MTCSKRTLLAALTFGLFACEDSGGTMMGGSGSSGSVGSTSNDSSTGGSAGTSGSGSGSASASASASTSASSGPSTTSGAGSTTGAQSCAAFEDEPTCTSASVNDEPCTWLEVAPATIGTNGCTFGDPVGFCVPGFADPGCAATPGCELPNGLGGEALWISLPEGGIAPYLTCGGPYVPDSQACQSTDDGFEPAECGCVCDGQGDGTGTGTDS